MSLSLSVCLSVWEGFEQLGNRQFVRTEEGHAALFTIICTFFYYEVISPIQNGAKLALPFVFSTISMLKSQVLYTCGDVHMNDGNRWILETIDLHSSLLSVMFLLVLLVFLVSKVASQRRFPLFFFFFSFFFFTFPSYISGIHHFWVRFLRMWPFFNPTIKVVTFRLRGWCVLGVAGIHPSRTWTSGSFESVRWNACVHRLDLGLYSHPKEFLGEWSLNPC